MLSLRFPALNVRLASCWSFLFLTACPAVLAGDVGSVALNGIAHVALRVADVPASREFYRKLGFEQAFEFGSGDSLVSYMKVNDSQFIELYARGPAGPPVGLMHLCLEMADTDRLFDVYQKLGLTPTEKRKARAGNLLFNLRDPEGQLIEYTQYLPGSLHSNARGKHLGQNRAATTLIGLSMAESDTTTARRFFVEKLGFSSQAKSVLRLRLPGDSGHELVVEPRAPGWKPRIEFGVTSAARSAKDLRRRGMLVSEEASSATIQDPDGNFVVFRH